MAKTKKETKHERELRWFKNYLQACAFSKTLENFRPIPFFYGCVKKV